MHLLSRMRNGDIVLFTFFYIYQNIFFSIDTWKNNYFSYKRKQKNTNFIYLVILWYCNNQVAYDFTSNHYNLSALNKRCITISWTDTKYYALMFWEHLSCRREFFTAIIGGWHLSYSITIGSLIWIVLYCCGIIKNIYKK